MKIVYNNISYTTNDLSNLLNTYPESVNLIKFIEQWLSNKSLFYFQTSGSTGIPKKIKISRNQILTSVNSTKEYLGLSSADKIFLALDPTFIASTMMTARALIIDMDMILVKPSSNPLNNIIASDATFASFVPFQIYKIIAEDNLSALEKINNILIGGAPLSHSAIEKLSKLKTNIFHTYGMTETVSHIALKRISENLDTCYRVLPDVSVKVDEEGCLRIYGTVTDNQWIQTHDIVELVNEKEFRWVGRRDNIINSGGVKIYPELIESIIARKNKEFNFSFDFFISGVKDDKLGEKCVLVVGEKIELSYFQIIRKSIKESLGDFYAPKNVWKVDSMVRTNSGKVKRKESLLGALEIF